MQREEGIAVVADPKSWLSVAYELTPPLPLAATSFVTCDNFRYIFSHIVCSHRQQEMRQGSQTNRKKVVTGPRGGKWYRSSSGKKIYLSAGPKKRTSGRLTSTKKQTARSQKKTTKKISKRRYDGLWNWLFPSAPPSYEPSGADLQRALELRWSIKQMELREAEQQFAEQRRAEEKEAKRLRKLQKASKAKEKYLGKPTKTKLPYAMIAPVGAAPPSMTQTLLKSSWMGDETTADISAGQTDCKPAGRGFLGEALNFDDCLVSTPCGRFRCYIMPIGTLVYHGTSHDVSPQMILGRGNWFGRRESAFSYMLYRSGVIYEYQVTTAVRLIALDDCQSVNVLKQMMIENRDSFSDPDKGIEALEKSYGASATCQGQPVRYSKPGTDEPVVKAICQLGLGGYISKKLQEFHPEVYICDPALHLVFTKIM